MSDFYASILPVDAALRSWGCAGSASCGEIPHGRHVIDDLAEMEIASGRPPALAVEDARKAVITAHNAMRR